MARRLEAAGHEVGVVTMLDTSFTSRVNVRDRVAREAKNLGTGRIEGARAVSLRTYRSTRKVLGKVRHGPRWTYYRLRGKPIPPGLAGKRLNHAAMAANRAYEPGAFGGTLTFIRATGDEDNHPTRDENSSLGARVRRWTEVAGRVEVRDAPGTHTGENSLVSEPNVAVVASLIEQALRDHATDSL
jgi:thioesterase domain-containing protein